MNLMKDLLVNKIGMTLMKNLSVNKIETWRISMNGLLVNRIET
jgi:hypothetical protein